MNESMKPDPAAQSAPIVPPEQLAASEPPAAATQPMPPEPPAQPTVRPRRVRPLNPLAQWRIPYRFWAFILPVLIYFYAYAAIGVFPFGNRHILTIDLYHQYAPFLVELRRKLLAGDNLLFSWSGGLGINFYALIAYYLASPFNLILLLFPESYLSEAILVLTMVKIGFAGWAFYAFLRNLTSRRSGDLAATAAAPPPRTRLRAGDPAAVGLAVCYALSGYVLAYSWNVMWLDSLIWLPLAALGIVSMLRRGTSPLLVIALTLLIVTNFYTGFFGCVFIGLFYFVLRERLSGERAADEHADSESGLRLWLIQLGLFAAHALLAAALSAFIIIPIRDALTLTSAAGDKFPQTLTFTHLLLDLLGRLFLFMPPAIRSGAPNLYVGAGSLILIGMVFLGSGVRAKVKALYAGLALFLVLSFDTNWLDFLWNGMHTPNQIPYRYAYVMTFLLLVMAWEGWRNRRRLAPRAPLIVFLALTAVILLLQRIDGNQFSQATTLATILHLALVAALVTAAAKPQAVRRSRQLATILAIFLVIEVFANSVITVRTIRDKEFFGNRADHTAGSQVEAIRDAVRQLQQEHPERIVRSEILPDRSVNDAILYGLNGLTVFSSTVPRAPIYLFAKLGYPYNTVNSYQYRSSTILLDSLLGIENLIWRSTPPVVETLREKVFDASGVTAWHNPDALPLAYFAPPTLPSFVPDWASPLANQNRLAEALGGEPEIMIPIALDLVSERGAQLRLEPDGKYTATADGTGDADLTFEFTAPEDGVYYMTWRSENNRVSQTQGKIDGKTIAFGGTWKGIADFGQIKAGQKTQLLLHLPQDSINGYLHVYAARLDIPKYRQLMAQLRENALEDVRIRGNRFSGRLTAPQNGWMLITTTDNPGWQIFVDGEPAVIEKVDECLMRVAVSAGSHQIEGRFIPCGLPLGAAISLAALVLFAGLWIWLDYRQRRGKNPVPAFRS